MANCFVKVGLVTGPAGSQTCGKAAGGQAWLLRLLGEGIVGPGADAGRLDHMVHFQFFEEKGG